MNEKTKAKFLTAMIYFVDILLILIILSFIGLEIYCWIRYGSLPADEVPSWVHWLMWRR